MSRATARPSIRDVAALAGVSHQTVSRVLNGANGVRSGTRERIERAIAELGYRPSKAARALATSDSRTIGVLGVHATLFGPSQMTFAIEAGARRRGYSTTAISVTDDDSALREARDHLEQLGVDAVVIMAWSVRVLEVAEAFAAVLPTRVITEGVVPTGLAQVSGANAEGARAATEALREAGRRRIAHLSGPEDWLEAKQRLNGWTAAAADLAGPVVTAGWDPGDGYRAVKEAVAADPEIDAIFAANDHVAIGAMKGLRELGRRVPDEVAIVGYDDIEVGGYLDVPLATVRQGFAEMGTAAVDLLFDVMRGDEPEPCIVNPTFVPRASVGGLS